MNTEAIIKETTFLNGLEHGWGNGYVLVPEGHPWHGVNYDDIRCEVHYGLTFGEIVTKELIEYWPELEERHEGMYMVGFDTAHLNDTQENWPKERVFYEAENLKQQAIDAGNGVYS